MCLLHYHLLLLVFLLFGLKVPASAYIDRKHWPMISAELQASAIVPQYLDQGARLFLARQERRGRLADDCTSSDNTRHAATPAQTLLQESLVDGHEAQR